MNYTDLVSELQEWTEDDSSEFQTAIPQIIRLAENRIFRDIPQFQTSRLTATGVLAGSSLDVSAISVMREIRAFSLGTGDNITFLQKRTDTYLTDYQPNPDTAGTPKFYAQSDFDTLRICPAPSASISYTLYYRGVADTQRLSATNSNSTLGDHYEDLILASALLSASVFLHDEKAIAIHTADYTAAKDAITGENSGQFSSEYGRGMRS